MDNKLDNYVTASELAQSLQVTRGQIYTMRREGLLPSGVKIGHVRRWRVSEIREWLKSHEL